MVFFKSEHVVSALAAASLPKDLNVTDTTSIQGVARTLASGAMSYYSGNAEAFVNLPAPYYWWECGALFGAMLDYSHYTGDTSYDETIATALLAQVGPDYDYMVPSEYGQEGNDDLSFWGFSVMSAAEKNFPQPNATVPSWLDLGANIFNSLASRWNTTACGGGLLWQIFASNPNGLDYRNSISTGGMFQLAARLARATGNATYAEWAEKAWDWTTAIGLVDDNYNVYDGASSSNNCTQINGISFTYASGVYLYGAAVMANYTGDAVWANRTAGLLGAAAQKFFSPYTNSTNVMYEEACEEVGTCDTDMLSFKGYLSRFMYASAIMVPSLAPSVNTLLQASALAAVNTCTGGNGTACGQKWYVGGFDGATGLGQEMCALETVQGLLAANAAAPFQGDQIQVVRDFASAAANASATSTATSVPASNPATTTQPSKRENAGVVASVDLRAVLVLSGIVGLLVSVVV